MLNQHENLINLEREGKDLIAKTTQAPKHTKIDYLGEIKQSGNTQKDM